MSLKFMNTTFALNTKTRNTAFFVHDSDDGNLEYSFDCSFEKSTVGEISFSPYLCINQIETSSKQIDELLGHCFEVENIENADEREDTFYIFEHEPLVRYTSVIKEIKDNWVLIHCEGVAIIDGYVRPYTKDSFELECWLPIITSVNDWEEFGL
ncbi:MAG: hypothetical protein RR565_01200 [Erysipelothrix sp.]